MCCIFTTLIVSVMLERVLLHLIIAWDIDRTTTKILLIWKQSSGSEIEILFLLFSLTCYLSR